MPEDISVPVNQVIKQLNMLTPPVTDILNNDFSGHKFLSSIGVKMTLKKQHKQKIF